MGKRIWRQRWRRIFPRDADPEVDDELEFHLEERVRDFIASGMDPEAARQAALERLGDLGRVRRECARLLAAERRAEKRRRLISVSWLDVKLGLRMLVKYPGLSLVAVIGMAVAIAIGAASFAAIYAVLDPTLPLDEGDRVVSIQNNRADNPGNPDRQAVHDFVQWRDELKSVADLAALRMGRRNLVTPEGGTELVRIAEMTASAFRVARVAPVLGRPLIDEDERTGALPVIVIAYEEWQRRFDGDPDILGQSVRLGNTVHTVVGVMPEGFRFPIQHRYWVPLQLNPSEYERGDGPSIYVVGRLEDGVTREQAQAELTTVGQRMAAAFPETHEHLRPRVLPYTHPFFDVDSPMMALALHGLQLAISLLLILVSVNVAILVYARTTTRVGEIAVRSALGASRRRIVMQLFVEALVLSAASAAAGLTLAGVALGQTQRLLDEVASNEVPFWFDLGLSPGLVGYVAGLAIVGGAIVGVLPALKATGKRVQAGLQQLSSHGSQMQLGRMWTALIVVQVAIAVAVLPGTIFHADEMVRFGTRDPGYAADEFISARLSMEREGAPPPVHDGIGEGRYRIPPSAAAAESERAFEARFADRADALFRRLQAEPSVVGVTVAARYPGTEAQSWIEVERSETHSESPAGRAPEQAARHRVGINTVGVGLLELFGVPILAGRTFAEADTREGSNIVIVDKTFADSIAGGANVLGRRIRYVDPSGDRSADEAGERRWFEIVGVVPDFPVSMEFTSEDAPNLYHPAERGEARSSYPHLIVRVRGSPAAFTTRLRNITASVDPALQLHDLMGVAESRRLTQQALRMTAIGVVAVTLSVLLLSAAGIYAMMSFTVARRRREIGIRAALGAGPRRLLTSILARAIGQLGVGVLVGLVLAAVLDRGTGGSVMGGKSFILLPVVSALIVAVGLLATLGPARRGLAVQPTEALREE